MHCEQQVLKPENFATEEKWLADCIKPQGKTNEVGLMV